VKTENWVNLKNIFPTAHQLNYGSNFKKLVLYRNVAATVDVHIRVNKTLQCLRKSVEAATLDKRSLTNHLELC